MPSGVGGDERVRLGDRAVDVRLGGEVDDRVAALDRVGDRGGVLDAADHEADVEVLQVLAPARVGQLVEDGDLVALGEPDADEVGADEAGAAADEQLHAATSTRARWALARRASPAAREHRRGCCRAR